MYCFTVAHINCYVSIINTCSGLLLPVCWLCVCDVWFLELTSVWLKLCLSGWSTSDIMGYIWIFFGELALLQEKRRKQRVQMCKLHSPDTRCLKPEKMYSFFILSRIRIFSESSHFHYTDRAVRSRTDLRGWCPQLLVLYPTPASLFFRHLEISIPQCLLLFLSVLAARNTN